MSHSKGPLRISGPSPGSGLYDDGGDCAIVDEEGRIIGGAIHCIDENTYRDAEANARLWASAPDLLAERDALRAALKFYADPASWKRKRCKQGGWPIAESQPVLKDRGERARDSLDAAEEAA